MANPPTRVKKATKHKSAGSDAAWLKKFNAAAGAQLAVMASGAGLEVDVVSTGVLAFDVALGVGGLPLGRVVELFGPEGCGKTTSALLTIAEAQRDGRPTLYIDAEHKLDLLWAKKLGVDLTRLALVQPSSGEAGFKALRTFLEIGGGVAAVDSVTTMTPQADIDASENDKQGQPARLAALMSKELSLLVGTGKIAKSNSLIMFLNQVRSKVGMVWGNPNVTTGGNALKFYSVCRVEFLGSQKVEGKTPRGKGVVATRIRVKVIKNQVASPFQHCEFYVNRQGLKRGADLITAGLNAAVLRRARKSKRSVIMFVDDGEIIGEGKDKASAEADAVSAVLDEELRDLLHDRVMRAIKTIDDAPSDPEIDELDYSDDDYDD